MTDWLLTHLAMLAPLLLQLSIKLTLLFASLWLLSMALRTFSPALRHRVWSAGIVGVFLAPLICHLYLELAGLSAAIDSCCCLRSQPTGRGSDRESDLGWE